MIENTLSSMKESQAEGVTPSSANLPKPKVGGIDLSAIPVLRPPSSAPTASHTPPSTSFTEPVSSEEYVEEAVEGKFEYEFTNLWDGCLYSVYLYDTSDVSACERVLNRPVSESELSYSNSGNGFVVDGEFKYTFCKNPYKRLFARQPSADSKLRRRQSIKVRTADDILAEL